MILGFRPHTGWAAVVALVLDRDQIVILDRRRIAYAPTGGRFLYHDAAGLPHSEAGKSIAVGHAETKNAAIAELKNLISQLKCSAAGAAIPGGNTKLPATLDKVFASHSLIHAAEGSFYRETLAEACASIGIPVQQPPAIDLWPMATASCGMGRAVLETRLRELGKRLGPPWGEDQRLATLAAWIYAAGESNKGDGGKGSSRQTRSTKR